MAAHSSERYFFGFAKFFRFGKEENVSVNLPNVPETSDEENEMAYSVPNRIDFLQDDTELCVTWSTIFQMCKTNGSVKVCGWGEGRNISSKENIFLPLDEKIVSLRGAWDKLLLISEKGSCHVMWNTHGDWTMHRVHSRDPSGTGHQGNTFLFGDISDMQCIVVDKDGKAYKIEVENTASVSKFLYCPISLEIRVDEISCGKEHVLLLNKEHGTVYSLGLGSRGQLALGQVDPEKTPKRIEALAGIRIQQIAAGGWHSLALSEFGDVYAWGWNDCGQLGITCLPPEVPMSFYMLPYIVEFPDECHVTAIACGARHSVAVASEPRVWTWGWGCYGQLGHGDRRDRKTPTIVEYFRNIDSRIVNVTCGPWQTIVYAEKNS